MNQTSNREVVRDVLMELAETDRDIIALASDSRGSAKMGPFADRYPEQFVETGIAEQNLVGIAAGLAASGKRPFITSPAAFLSMRSIEQIKVDVAYSRTNVKIVAISGGVSYGALGMSHHSLQDMAVTRAIPGLDVMIPADRHETRQMMSALATYDRPVYMRIGRNPVEDVYESSEYDFSIGKAVTMKQGSDATLIANGETVRVAMDAAEVLEAEGIHVRVLNMHTIKPLDVESVLKAASETGYIVTLEEHSVFGGLGSAIAEVIVQNEPVPMRILGIPDEPAVTGKTKEVFAHYGITPAKVSEVVKELMGWV